MNRYSQINLDFVFGLHQKVLQTIKTEMAFNSKFFDLYDSIVNADVPGSEGDSIAARPASTK